MLDKSGDVALGPLTKAHLRRPRAHTLGRCEAIEIGGFISAAPGASQDSGPRLKFKFHASSFVSPTCKTVDTASRAVTNIRRWEKPNLYPLTKVYHS